MYRITSFTSHIQFAPAKKQTCRCDTNYSDAIYFTTKLSKIIQPKTCPTIHSQVESGSFWTTTSNRTGTNLLLLGNRRFYLIVGCCQPQLNLDFKKGQIKRGTIPNRLSRLPYPWLLPASPCQWWSKVYAVSVNAQVQFGLFSKKKANTANSRFFPFQFSKQQFAKHPNSLGYSKSILLLRSLSSSASLNLLPNWTTELPQHSC